MDDKNLVKLLFDRDESALELMRREYGKTLFFTSKNIVGSFEDAEECVNDTLLAVWNTVPPREPEKLLGYTLKIVRNLSLKKWREKNAQKRKGDSAPVPLCELEECISAGKSIDESLESKEIARVIDAFLKGLKKGERDIFVLRYFYVCSTAEISQRLCISKSQVKTSLFRTRQKLSIKLEKEGVIL